MMRNNFELLPTDFRLYDGATKAELGYGDEAVDSRFVENIAPNGQLLGIYETKPKTETDHTIIMPASHDYRIEPTIMKRADIIASSANARVILVDMPGTTGLLHDKGDGEWGVYESTKRLHGANQKPLQLTAALKGDFTLHSAMQLAAINETVGLSEAGKNTLLGESMGAAEVTAMIEVAQEYGISVEEVILYELVNPFKGYRPSVPVKLVKVLPSVENSRRNRYIDENDIIGHHATAFELENSYQAELDKARKKVIGQQGLAAAVNGLGMAMGIETRLMANLERLPKGERPEITMVRGNESLATNANDYHALQEALSTIGVSAKMYSVTDAYKTPYPMGHSHSFSLSRQRQIADVLFSQK